MKQANLQISYSVFFAPFLKDNVCFFCVNLYSEIDGNKRTSKWSFRDSKVLFYEDKLVCQDMVSDKNPT